MKQLIFALLLIAGSSVFNATSAANTNVTTKKAACITVGLAATASSYFWYPSTIKTISQYGVAGAIVSTHILRHIIDLGTIGLCAVYFNDLCKK